MNTRLPFKVESGDIVLVGERSFQSWLLRILHGPFPYSHGCLMGEKVNGRQTIYTAAYRGPGDPILAKFGLYRQIDAADYLKDRNYVVCRYKQNSQNLSRAQKQEIIEWCKSQLGEKYPIKKVLKYLGIGLKGYGVPEVIHKELTDREHCFEGVAKAYLKAGIVLNERAKNADPSGYDGKEIYLSPNLVDIFTKTRAA